MTFLILIGSAGRSPFDAAVISQGVFSNLYSRNQLYPMTELAHRLGPRHGLEERMLVRVAGEVMAIACMQNTQHLYYRADLFQRHGLACQQPDGSWRINGCTLVKAADQSA